MGLGELFSWVPQLITWLLGWVPHMGRIHSYEAGVKISGPQVRELRSDNRLLGIGPRGVFLWVPHFSEIFKDNVVRKVVELPEQLLTTKDKKRVRAGGILVYRIEDVATWLSENEDPDHGVQVEAARVLREWVVGMTFAEVQGHSTSRDDSLTQRAQAALDEDFGVVVIQVALASFAETEARDLHHGGTLTTKSDAPTTIIRMD
jgi:regulator of protease activity HflC (stomatin/prohibitin superfamily)